MKPPEVVLELVLVEAEATEDTTVGWTVAVGGAPFWGGAPLPGEAERISGPAG